MAACAAPAAPAAQTGDAAPASEGATEIRVATWGDTTDKTVYESIGEYIAEIMPEIKMTVEQYPGGHYDKIQANVAAATSAVDR